MFMRTCNGPCKCWGDGEKTNADLHSLKPLTLLKDELYPIAPAPKIEVVSPIHVMPPNGWVTKLADPFPNLLFNRPKLTLKNIPKLWPRINFIHFYCSPFFFFLFFLIMGKMLQNWMRKSKQMQLISDQIQYKITLAGLSHALIKVIHNVAVKRLMALHGHRRPCKSAAVDTWMWCVKLDMMRFCICFNSVLKASSILCLTSAIMWALIQSKLLISCIFCNSYMCTQNDINSLLNWYLNTWVPIVLVKNTWINHPNHYSSKCPHFKHINL